MIQFWDFGQHKTVKELVMGLYEKKKAGPVIVAELSGNHGGSLQRAMELMSLAAASGADAVKIQTYEPDSITLDSRRDEFLLKDGLWQGQSLYELYQKAKTPRSFVKPLFSYAKDNGIFLFSSPFCNKDVEVLEKNDCPVYKIASFELVDLNLIALCAGTKKPLIMSTGLATLEEIDRAYDTAVKHGALDITLLHCESHYPAEAAMFNLRTICFFKKRYGCHAGLSNHALGNTLDIAATALGAELIEKHFIDDRKAGTVDAPFSMTPKDLRLLVRDTADTAAALGTEEVILRDRDLKERTKRRSVYLTHSLKKGDILKEDQVRVVRPGLGLEPYKLPYLIGKKAQRDLKAPLPLCEEDFA